MTHVDTHAPGTVSWYDLMSPDAEKARAFYAPLLGWSYDLAGPELGFYATARVDGRPAAGIGQIPKDTPMPSAWTVYFATADIEATLQDVNAHGGSTLMGPMDVPEQGRAALCADPTGATFGLWQPRAHLGAGVIDQPGAMTWQECNTRDPERARAFYAGVFGLETKPMEGMDGYWTLHRGEQMAGGIMHMTPDWPADMPAHWMGYFAVDGTDAAAERAKSLGGQLLHGPFDTPYGRIAVLADPFGAVFSVITLSRPS